MTQISRPFVIALAAVVLFAGVWFVALKPHTSSTTGPEATASAPTPAQASAAQEKAAAAPSQVDHTSTPGVEGLTKDINKAHGAVAAAQGSAGQTQEKAAQASGTSSTPASSPAPAGASKSTPSPAAAGAAAKSPASAAEAAAAAKSAANAAAAAAASKSSSSTHASGGQTAKSSTGSAQSGSPRVPAGQALVEAALKENRVALILFWDPKSAEDQAVHLSVSLIAGVHEIFESLSASPKTSQQLKSKGISLQQIAVFEAGAGEVASFGSFTRTVQVYQTPTILIVNPLGQITPIPGYTESRAIAQRLGESRMATEQSAAKASQHAAK